MTDNTDTDLFTIRKEIKNKVFHVTVGKELEGTNDQYQPLIEILQRAKEGDAVNLYIDCCGGSTNISCAIANAIYDSKAVVHAIITGRSYSAACDIALAADSLTLNKYTFLMFHNYSTSLSGKGNELTSRLENEHKIEKQMISKLYSPFLTEQEIEDILNDKDIYIHWDDLNLKERIKRHFGQEDIK